MIQSSLPIVDSKNKWLWSQVDVEYPTAESLQGRSLYQALIESRQVEELSVSEPQPAVALDDIYLVDFHRLTIMFALLQATQFDSEQQQNLLVEFFTQIIYSQPCSLYLGFADGQPAAAAILTEQDNQVLLSDIVVKNSQPFGAEKEFALAVLSKWRQGHEFSGQVYWQR